jgi:hypothetical protein
VGEYIPTTSTINSAPRFDHDPTTGESLGLLVEEQRTNLLLPTYSASVFLKAGTLDKASILVSGDGGTTPDGRVVFDFAVKTATNFSSTGLVSASITEFPNGWFRCVVVATISSNTNPRVLIYPDTYNAAVAGSIYAWGAQLEAGSFPTSYIPTTDATATRAADVASISGSNFGVSRTNLLLRSEEFSSASWVGTRSSVVADVIAAPNWGAQLETGSTATAYIPTTTAAVTVVESPWYRQDEGTVFAEFQPRANATAGVAYLNAGSVNEATRIFYNSTISNYTFSVRTAGVEQSSINNLGAYVLQSERISAAYKVNDLAASRNGGASVSDVSATLSTGIDRLNLGTTQGPNYLNGTIRRLTYWPARLPNETLQTITQ